MGEYIIPATGLIVVAIIEALAMRERRESKEEKRREEEREEAREALMVLLIQSTRAAIALGEATAHALQRGHTNGDTAAALEYATKVKREQKDFLAKQGIHAIWD